MIFNNRKTRRQFLIGSGKSVLALPFLGSLWPYTAFGAGAEPKKFVSLNSHLGQREEWWRPFNLGASVTRDSRTYREVSLALLKDSGINHILTSTFAPYMDKMIFIEGLDIPTKPGHNGGEAALGHMSATDPWQTIDQVIAPALYNRIYKTTPTIPILLINNGNHGPPSFRYSGSSIIRVPGVTQPRALVERIFRQHNPTVKARNQKVMDKMVTAYRSLATNSRLSKDDKIRVEAYADLFNDYENRLSSMAPLQQNCSAVDMALIEEKLMTVEEMTKRHQLFNDAIVLSLSCGASQVVNANIANTHLSTQTTPHGWSHISETSTSALENREAQRDMNKWLAETSVLDLVKKMDAMPDGSGTLLDNSVVFWGNELSHGQSHDQNNMPAVIFGGGGGSLRTGYLYNYERPDGANIRFGLKAGRLYNQLLVTLMQSMGLTEDDYARKNPDGSIRRGYGAYITKNIERRSFYAAVEDDHYLPLPGMLR